MLKRPIDIAPSLTPSPIGVIKDKKPIRRESTKKPIRGRKRFTGRYTTDAIAKKVPRPKKNKEKTEIESRIKLVYGLKLGKKKFKDLSSDLLKKSLLNMENKLIETIEKIIRGIKKIE